MTLSLERPNASNIYSIFHLYMQLNALEKSRNIMPYFSIVSDMKSSKEHVKEKNAYILNICYIHVCTYIYIYIYDGCLFGFERDHLFYLMSSLSPTPPLNCMCL